MKSALFAPEEKIFAAQAVSPGIAIGRVFCRSVASPVETAIRKIEPEAVQDELDALTAAVSATTADITQLHAELKSKLDNGDADIFNSHLMLLADPGLLKDVRRLISREYYSADAAYFTASEKYASALGEMPDEYFRERAADVRDVAQRVLNHLRKTQQQRNVPEDKRIIFAHDLAPSETATLDRSKVLGFALECGSITSHTAILARSLHLPAVVGLPHEALENITAADRVILDGFSGKIIINPQKRTEEAYRLKADAAGKFYSSLQRDNAVQAETLDGFTVQLGVNLESLDNLAESQECGANGVGLFRTEFLLFNRTVPPGEEEQFEVYKSLMLGNERKPVIIRTFDIGGDKSANIQGRTFEANPFLGLRGIRLCLREQRELFKTQLKALMRAAEFGDLRIMLPMVSVPEEIFETRNIMLELQKELTAEKKSFARSVKLGVMIETPAAALLVDRISAVVDFLSIGSNDLVQYTLAIDRSNERVAYLYQPSHPVILQLIARCVEAARRHNIWVGICGQMAGEVELTPVLVGLGVHELSMSPSSIGAVRRVIRSVKLHDAEILASQVLECTTAEEAIEMSRAMLWRVAPELAQNLLSEVKL